MRPIEGIDKIGVLLNPLFLNKDFKKRRIDPYNRLEIHTAGVFKVLTIKQEYLNKLFDFQAQIALAIYELIKQGIIDFPDNFLTPLFIYKNPSYFILNIIALEFYFSLEKDEIEIDEDMVKNNIDEAKEDGCLYRYVDENKVETETYYSNDKGTNYHRSSFILYNKQDKDLHDNQIPKDVILAFGKPMRIEFRLYADNSKWLHWDNLRGNYQDILDRHLQLLATTFNTKVRGCITLNSNENKNLKRIIKLAEKRDPIRFTGKELKKKTLIKPNENSEIVIRNYEKFSLKNVNIENAKKLKEINEKLDKNRGGYYKIDEN
jgi:hypothetical protein